MFWSPGPWIEVWVWDEQWSGKVSPNSWVGIQVSAHPVLPLKLGSGKSDSTLLCTDHRIKGREGKKDH